MRWFPLRKPLPSENVEYEWAHSHENFTANHSDSIMERWMKYCGNENLCSKIESEKFNHAKIIPRKISAPIDDARNFEFGIDAFEFQKF